MQHYLTQYQSANLTDKESKANFIVRKNDFNKVMADIKTTKDEDSFQHYLFVGRRGSGKSTLLRRIQAELSTDEKLSKKFLAVNLGEEQSGIYKLYDLWDYVIRDFKATGHEMPDIDFRDYASDLKSYSKKLHQIIIDFLRQQNKRLVLLVDNIDRIFKNSGNETNLLRELLMNYNEIRIIGGSTYMSEAFWKYDMPFYQYFTIRQLKALSLDEIKALLHHWSEVKELPEIKTLMDKYPGKIQSIRMLTDGTPRTMLLFVDMLINRPEQNGYAYLQVIVDKSTPIYQERLGTLSPAQQKVLTELSFFWEAASVDQLIVKCTMEGKTISAILNQLTKLHYVEKIKGQTKNLLYRLEERFFNLWLIMTQGGPQQRLEAKYLTHFLEYWYNTEELNQLCQGFITETDNDNLKKDYLLPMGNALLHSDQIDSQYKQELYIQLRSKHELTAKQLGNVEDYFKDIDKDIATAFESKNYTKAIELLNVYQSTDGKKEFGLAVVYEELKNIKLAEEYYLLAIDKNNTNAIVNLAFLYNQQGQFLKAEKYYLLAINNGDNLALFNLAYLYQNQGKFKKSEKYYLLAINKGDIDAIINLGILYYKHEKFEMAEKYYLLAIDKDDVSALFNLAILYDNQEKFEKAEKYYLLAINKDHVNALNNLAILYKNQEKFEMAEKYYLLAINKGDIDAIFNLAHLYNSQEKYIKAEKYYLLAIDKNYDGALNNLAHLYQNQEKYIKTEKYYLLAIDKGEVDALINLGNLYQDQEKFKLAEKYYLLAVNNGHINALNNITNFYYNKNKNKLKAILIKSKRENTLDHIRIELLMLSYLYIGELELFTSAFNHYKTTLVQSTFSEPFIIELQVHKQHHLALQLFELSEEAVERYKPLYYATLKIINPQDNQLLKIPPEIEENVQDIINYINKRKNHFYG